MTVIDRIRLNGYRRTGQLAFRCLTRPIHLLRHRRAPDYRDPDSDQLQAIERGLREAGLNIESFDFRASELEHFRNRFPFPEDYHGGIEGPVWHEKLFEHFVAYRLGRLRDFDPEQDVYVDVAACESPWAYLLRQAGYRAFAIDLDRSARYGHLSYYRRMDATRTLFAADSVRTISLQCAFEMFLGDADSRFVDECARILTPGGRAVIVPLYMHTHPCGYSAPAHFNRGYADPGAKTYIRRNDLDTRFSRKYSVATLQSRILDRARENQLGFHLYAVTDKDAAGPGVYCHFVLVLEKSQPTGTPAPGLTASQAPRQ